MLERFGELLDGETWPRPEPGAGEGLVRVAGVHRIGLTVLNCISRRISAPTWPTCRACPATRSSARSSAVGPGVDAARVGERVMAYFYLCCGECRRCLEGPESLCERLAGVIGVHRDGGYAEYAALPARNLLALPAGLGAAEATAIPDAIATPVHVAGARAHPRR